MRRQLRKQAYQGISWLNFPHRAAVRRQVEEAIPAAVHEEARQRAAQYALSLAEARDQWERLLQGETVTVTDALQKAACALPHPASVVTVTRDPASAKITFPPLSAMPERKPATTAAGQRTAHKRTKSERNDLYVRAMAPTVLTTAKAAFATAPSLDEAKIMVCRRDPEAYTPDDHHAAIHASRFPRSHTAGHGGSDPVAEILSAPGAQLQRHGRSGDITPINAKFV